MEDHQLKKAFLQLLRNKDNEGDYFLARVRAWWPRAFGKRVAQQTVELKARKKTLYIYVNNSALRQQLHMVRADILKRVEEEVGERYFEAAVIK